MMIFMGEEMDERDERTALRASWVGTAAGRWKYGLEMGCAMGGEGAEESGSWRC